MSFRFEDGYVVAYTDGCCLNNNHPNFNARASGIGVYFTYNNPLNVSQRAIVTQVCPPTNNNAEIQACTKAIRIIRNNGFVNARIFTDSLFVINSINGTYVNTSWTNKWALDELKAEISQMNFISWVPVPSHQTQQQIQADLTGHAYGNMMAHQLANMGAHKSH